MATAAWFIQWIFRRLLVIDDPRTPLARPIRIVHRGLDRLPPAAAALRELMLEAPALVADEHD